MSMKTKTVAGVGAAGRQTVGAHDGDEAEMQMPSFCDGCGPCQWSGSFTLLCGWQASKQKSDLFSRFGAARLLYKASAWLGISVAEDEIFCRRDGVWVRVGEG